MATKSWQKKKKKMTNKNSIDEVQEQSTFQPADIEGTLNPASTNKVQVDPISSQIAISKEIEEQEENEKKKQEEREETLRKIKSGITISGIVVAVAGALFAITKKLREK